MAVPLAQRAPGQFLYAPAGATTSEGQAQRAFAAKCLGRELPLGPSPDEGKGDGAFEVHQTWEREVALQRQAALQLSASSAGATTAAQAILWVSEWIYLPTVGALRSLDGGARVSEAGPEAAAWAPVATEALDTIARRLRIGADPAGRYAIAGVARADGVLTLLALYEVRTWRLLQTLPA